MVSKETKNDNRLDKKIEENIENLEKSVDNFIKIYGKLKLVLAENNDKLDKSDKENIEYIEKGIDDFLKKYEVFKPLLLEQLILAKDDDRLDKKIEENIEILDKYLNENYEVMQNIIIKINQLDSEKDKISENESTITSQSEEKFVANIFSSELNENKNSQNSELNQEDDYLEKIFKETMCDVEMLEKDLIKNYEELPNINVKTNQLDSEKDKILENESTISESTEEKIVASIFNSELNENKTKSELNQDELAKKDNELDEILKVSMENLGRDASDILSANNNNDDILADDLKLGQENNVVSSEYNPLEEYSEISYVESEIINNENLVDVTEKVNNQEKKIQEELEKQTKKIKEEQEKQAIREEFDKLSIEDKWKKIIYHTKGVKLQKKFEIIPVSEPVKEEPKTEEPKTENTQKKKGKLSGIISKIRKPSKKTKKVMAIIIPLILALSLLPLACNSNKNNKSNNNGTNNKNESTMDNNTNNKPSNDIEEIVDNTIEDMENQNTESNNNADTEEKNEGTELNNTQQGNAEQNNSQENTEQTQNTYVNIVGLTETAQVYNDEYSAYLDENGNSLHFGNESEKVYLGGLYEDVNGNWQYIYISNPMAKQIADELVNNGGKCLSILIAEKTEFDKIYDGNNALTISQINQCATGWIRADGISNPMNQTNGMQRSLHR